MRSYSSQNTERSVARDRKLREFESQSEIILYSCFKYVMFFVLVEVTTRPAGSYKNIVFFILFAHTSTALETEWKE